MTDRPGRPPRAPDRYRHAGSAADAARLELIASPGLVQHLPGRFSDVGRASAIAAALRRAKPSRLDPAAAGSFDARAFFDPTEHRWRIAARYLPPTTSATGTDTIPAGTAAGEAAADSTAGDGAAGDGDGPG